MSGAQLLGDEGGVEEVLTDELRQRVADLILLAFDDRGVWDRQAQWVAEERGDGEPVRDATHHAGLGGGLDVADPGRGIAAVIHDAADGEDDRREDQQTRGDGLVLAQVVAPLGLGLRGGAGHWQAAACWGGVINAAMAHPTSIAALGLRRSPRPGRHAPHPHSD